MQFFFVLVAVAGSAWFLFRKRRVDLFTVGFASCLLYFLPGFFGYVRSSRDFSVPEALLPETYAVFIIVMLAVLVGAILYDHTTRRDSGSSSAIVPLNLTTEMALALATFGLLATIVFHGDVLFSAKKSEILAGIGRWHLVYRYAAVFAVVFAVIRGQTLLAIAGFALLSFDLFVGFRFGLVIAVIAAFLVSMNRKGPVTLFRTQKSALLAGVAVIAAVLVYKQVYVFVKLGLWDVVGSRLLDPVVLRAAVLNSEPFTTQSILNEVLRSGLYTGGEHLRHVANLFVPFATLLGAETESFNAFFQRQLFGGVVEGGMANNFWAELFAIGQWFGVITGAFLFAGLLALGSSLLIRAKGATVSLIAVLFTIIAFYLHRNDIGFELTILRRCLVVWALLVLPGMALVDVYRTRVHA